MQYKNTLAQGQHATILCKTITGIRPTPHQIKLFYKKTAGLDLLLLHETVEGKDVHNCMGPQLHIALDNVARLGAQAHRVSIYHYVHIRQDQNLAEPITLYDHRPMHVLISDTYVYHISTADRTTTTVCTKINFPLPFSTTHVIQPAVITELQDSCSIVRNVNLYTLLLGVHIWPALSSAN